MKSELNKARDEWLIANDAAVDEASTYLNKKGNFNPPLEKPWPKWEELRTRSDEKWYAYRNMLKEQQA